ncbi:DUF3927 family protein [Salmonella enterica]|nr:DUF3927 domain-containing protein [Salmonella enterica]EBP3303897.1 DUF3927 domain-containing protein [Salmonella enterica subsp. enterica]ECT9504633.1 DUF3927 domain-containing protein [Salmonella enterica subsp. enterica serovar Eastbourne]EDI2364112.1 DUF3927 domain-containing protein [Salmonella enterica subsp. enterica serovar Poona]EHR5102819.1 DUF3927 family protein [Salmonella enterica subsp. enterica serovar Braenderup]
MLRVLDSLRPALALLLAFMVVAVDFTSYLLSVIGDAFFVGALLLLVWPVLKSANQSADHQ